MPEAELAAWAQEGQEAGNDLRYLLSFQTFLKQKYLPMLKQVRKLNIHTHTVYSSQLVCSPILKDLQALKEITDFQYLVL